MSEDVEDDGEGIGRDEGRRAAGEESGGNADDEEGDGSRVEAEEVEVELAQLLLAPQVGRATSLLPSMILRESMTSQGQVEVWWLSYPKESKVLVYH